MPAIVDPDAFRTVYRSSVTDVMRFVTREKQVGIAKHNQSFHPDRYDLGAYLEASEERYIRVVQMVNRHAVVAGRELNTLDAGGFLAAFPLTLARMGIPTTIAEVYGYYGGAFDDLRAFIEGQGVYVWDADVSRELEESPDEEYMLVTNMAMLEHLPDSPKAALDNLRRLVHPQGKLLLEVPNLLYWPNRLKVLRGRTLHPPLEMVYQSEPPFIGHHREYTEQELRDVLGWSGFKVDEVDAFNYSLSLDGDLRTRLYALLVYAWPTAFRSCREVLLACAGRA